MNISDLADLAYYWRTENAIADTDEKALVIYEFLDWLRKRMPGLTLKVEHH